MEETESGTGDTVMGEERAETGKKGETCLFKNLIQGAC